MTSADDVRERGEKQLCSPETFLHFLGVEIERFARYQRDFTVVLIRPQDFGNQRMQLQGALAASKRVLGLLRTCDLITIFEENPFVVALLPETGKDGARAVFERFDGKVIAQGAGWILKAATYTEHSASIGEFLLWFNEQLFGLGRKTAPSDGTKSSSRYSQLSFATSNVTRSWRDL